jgi:hypothetical protein
MKEDLEPLAEKRTHHLYFELLPCSQRGHGFTLITGTVFVATEDERKTILGRSESEEHLYKVHIPLDLRRIIEVASSQGALDLPGYLRQAETDGLCVRVGGAQMVGLALFSNMVQAPLAIRDNSLVVLADNRHGG